MTGIVAFGKVPQSHFPKNGGITAKHSISPGKFFRYYGSRSFDKKIATSSFPQEKVHRSSARFFLFTELSHRQ